MTGKRIHTIGGHPEDPDVIFYGPKYVLFTDGTRAFQSQIDDAWFGVKHDVENREAQARELLQSCPELQGV